MNARLHRDILAFAALLALLILAALAGDAVLHHFDLVWVGRYLGIPGTLLIVLSLIYSLRKRKVIQAGSPRFLLGLHETLTWIGALMVLIHAGVHFNAILPWLAMAGLLVNVVSGLVGKLLLGRSRRHLAAIEEKFRLHGMAKAEIDKHLFWDSVAFETMAKWRRVHFPISYLFAVLAVGHIVSIFLFWEWK